MYSFYEMWSISIDHSTLCSVGRILFGLVVILKYTLNIKASPKIKPPTKPVIVYFYFDLLF